MQSPSADALVDGPGSGPTTELMSRRFLVTHASMLAIALLLIFVGSKPVLHDIDRYKLAREIGLVMLTLTIVELTWHFFVKRHELQVQKEITIRTAEDIGNRVKRLLQINEMSLLAVEGSLGNLAAVTQQASGEVVIVKVYVPGAAEFVDALEQRILEGYVKSIKIFVLDNRHGSDGAKYQAERASVTGIDFQTYLTQSKEGLEQYCRLARRIRDLPTRKRSSLDFKVFLFNELPTVSITQLRSERSYLSFFFYGKRSLQGPQFLVDLNQESPLKKTYKEHLERLEHLVSAQSENGEKCVFDMMKAVPQPGKEDRLPDVDDLEDSQKRIVVTYTRPPRPSASPKT